MNHLYIKNCCGNQAIFKGLILLDNPKSILYSTLMNSRHSVIFTRHWPDLKSFIYFSNENKVDPVVRLLLTSGGTLTTVLQTLLMSPVSIEIVQQTLLELDPVTTQFLELKDSEKGFFREVWLLNDKKERIVYASSYLPMNSLSPFLSQELKPKNRSIGELIDTYQLASLRDKMTFGKIEALPFAKEFNSSPETTLWIRHYRLSVPNHLLASIHEVFSPSLFKF